MRDRQKKKGMEDSVNYGVVKDWSIILLKEPGKLKSSNNLRSKKQVVLLKNLLSTPKILPSQLDLVFKIYF